MNLGKAIASVLNNNQDHHWSTVYSHWTKETNDWENLAFSHQETSRLKSPNDFTAFIAKHPEFGILVIDNRHRPRIIHAIKHHENDVFNGTTTNHLFSDPIEFELRRNTFNPIRNNTSDTNEAPGQSATTQNNTNTNNENQNETGLDQPNQTTDNNTNNNLPDDLNPNELIDARSWSQLATEFPQTPRTPSLILIHPILLHVLLPSLPLDPQTTTQILQAFINSALPKIEPAIRTRAFTWSLFTTFSTISTLMNADKPSRIFIENPMKFIPGRSYIKLFTPTQPTNQTILDLTNESPSQHNNNHTPSPSPQIPTNLFNNITPYHQHSTTTSINQILNPTPSWKGNEPINPLIRIQNTMSNNPTIHQHNFQPFQDPSNPSFTPYHDNNQFLHPHHPPTYKLTIFDSTPQPSKPDSAIHQIIEILLHGKSSSKKNVLQSLTSQQQLIFCRISAPHPNHEEIAYPSQSCINLLQEGTS
jgi:hypothetical protein